MKLHEALNEYAQGVNPTDYHVQVNYRDVTPDQFDSIELHDDDIVRLSKPFELPIQFIIGEED